MKFTYIPEITIFPNNIIKPYLENSQKEIVFPLNWVKRPNAITFAEAAIGVKFPPKQAPNDNEYQMGSRLLNMEDSEIDNFSMTGIIAATKGTLFKKPVKKEEIVKIERLNISKELPAKSTSILEKALMIPVSSSAPAIKNKAKKNKIFSHSTLDNVSFKSFGLRINNEKKPAAKATVELSKFNSCCKAKARITAPNKSIDTINSFLFSTM